MKRAIAIIIASFLLGVASSVINCNGTRIRTTDNDVSLSQAMANLNALSGLTAQSLDGGQNSAMLTQFISDVNDSTQSYSFYYGQAPGAMADTVTQLVDFAPQFSGWPEQVPSGGVTALWLYFIVSADGTRAGLVIAGSNGTAASATATPTPAATASPTTSTASTTSTVTPTFYFVALNDGSSYSSGNLQSGSFGSTDWDIDMNLDGVSTITLQTEDLSNGDLADTLQFDVYNTTAGTHIGRINVTQPDGN